MSKASEYTKAYWKRLRIDLLNNYGKVCACCGEDKIEFLCIDHINKNGCKHRKELGGTYRVWVWLRKNNYPSGYRVLCQNCNQSYGIYGHCPHQKNEML